MLIEHCLHVRNYAKHFGHRERDLKGTNQPFWFVQTSCVHGYRTVRAKTENSRQTRINFFTLEAYSWDTYLKEKKTIQEYRRYIITSIFTEWPRYTLLLSK